MKFSNYLFVLGLALLLGFTMTSCETVKPGTAAGTNEDGTIPPTPPSNNSGKIETKGFLATKDLALKSWLKKRFSVRYNAVSPQEVFGMEPLKEIQVRTSNLPTDAPPFSISSSGLSRRELLKKIADFWDLEIVIQTDAEGNPNFISATGKAVSSSGDS